MDNELKPCRFGSDGYCHEHHEWPAHCAALSLPATPAIELSEEFSEPPKSARDWADARLHRREDAAAFGPAQLFQAGDIYRRSYLALVRRLLPAPDAPKEGK